MLFSSRALVLVKNYRHRRTKTVIFVTNYLTKGTLRDCEGHTETFVGEIERREWLRQFRNRRNREASNQRLAF